MRRGELLMLAVVLTVGLALRCAFPSRAAVEHFDEGVYAARLWFQPDERIPFLHLYAPPLLPYLTRGSVALFGPRGIGPMLPGLVAGWLTVPIVWWLTRSWFGTAAGIAAAVLAAASDIHLLYSRTALTDPLLVFWLVAAVALIWISYRAPRPLTIGAAGLAAGLAWWTKYNGWLPLAIGLAGLVPWLICGRPAETSVVSKLAVWLAITLVALVVWLPVLMQIERDLPGGYADVARNHSRYVVGLAGWWDALANQAANHRRLDGWLTWIALSFAVLATSACGRVCGGTSVSPVRQTWITVTATAIGLSGAAALFGSTPLLALLGACGIALELRPTLRTSLTLDERQRLLAAWLLAAWYVGLVLATPLYTPYPRLTLPWLAAAWIGTAALLSRLIQRLADLDFPRARVAAACAPLLATGVAGLLAAGLTSRIETPPAYRDRTGLQSIAGHIAADVAAYTGRPADDPRRPAVLYVYAEPALVHHLAGRGIVAPPVGDLEVALAQSLPPDVPAFLVVGPHARRSAEFAEQWQRVEPRLDRVAEYDYHPSVLVDLNLSLGSAEAAAGRETVQLFALRETSPPRPRRR